MNRRRFLQLGAVGLGAAAAIAALPKIAASLPPVLNPEVPTTAYSTYVMGKNAMISEYCDYVNFSDFVLASKIDEHVAQAAEELGRAHAKRISRLVEHTGPFAATFAFRC